LPRSRAPLFVEPGDSQALLDQVDAEPEHHKRLAIARFTDQRVRTPLVQHVVLKKRRRVDPSFDQLDTYSHAIPAMQETAAALVAALVFEQKSVSSSPDAPQ
jgi:hypothetical protein